MWREARAWICPIKPEPRRRNNRNRGNSQSRPGELSDSARVARLETPWFLQAAFKPDEAKEPESDVVLVAPVDTYDDGRPEPQLREVQVSGGLLQGRHTFREVRQIILSLIFGLDLQNQLKIIAGLDIRQEDRFIG